MRRFRHEWEREATLELRAGNADVADIYVERGRVESGTREDMLDLLFDAWMTDTTAGRNSLMVAADAQTVADLNARARDHRVERGEVTSAGVTVTDGTTIGVGDVVVTRLNARALAAGRGWVKNGDDWIAREVGDDRSLRIARLGRGETTTLPAEYVVEHVELGYASTAHRAQGRTVETAHAYLTSTTTRESLYVMATRGRESNRLYVDTASDRDLDTSHGPAAGTEHTQVIRSAIATTGAEVAATPRRRSEMSAAQSPWRIEGHGTPGLRDRDRPGHGGA